ncbi:hypothetical protein EA462_06585 [Natrarchaeobius halalkaliphilus]|uniref:Uncharacterized protein n=2 Tax=Natrarchaeobius halalkaliphilus TaxID=1679091 RepID=A0A3N6N0Z8_9EURY|nr:hypothetical protein EA462_06585 [Natrarchaeobius halalkaliphilus]
MVAGAAPATTVDEHDTDASEHELLDDVSLTVTIEHADIFVVHDMDDVPDDELEDDDVNDNGLEDDDADDNGLEDDDADDNGLEDDADDNGLEDDDADDNGLEDDDADDNGLEDDEYDTDDHEDEYVEISDAELEVTIEQASITQIGAHADENGNDDVDDNGLEDDDADDNGLEDDDADDNGLEDDDADDNGLEDDDADDNGLEDDDADDNGLEDDDADDNGLEDDDADDNGLEDDDAVDRDELDVTVEHATVFVVIEDGDLPNDDADENDLESVDIDQATVFVVIDEFDDDADEELTDEEADDELDEDGVDDDANAVDDVDDNESVVEGHEISIEQATIIVMVDLDQLPAVSPVDDTDLEDDDADDNGLEDDDADDNGLEDGDADDNGLEDDDADDNGLEDGDAADGDQITVTIEQATIFVYLEEADDEIEEEPVEEDPVEEEPVDEEPEEDPVEEEPVDEEPEEDPVEEEPSESFTVDALDAPENATVGEPITVTATVSNPGDSEDTQDVQFRLDGDLVESQDVTLEADETDDVVFDIETEGLEAGEYFHMVLTDEFGEVAVLELTEEEPVEEEPVEEEPVEEEPVEEEPVEEEPVEEEPVEEEPVEEEPVEEEPEEDPEDTDEPVPANVTFEDQATDGQTVVVDEVTMASGGFVVVHDSSLLVGDVFGSILGASDYLEPGTHENVEVTLEQPLEEDETLIAMAHRDTNDNQELDFVESDGQEDVPYEVAGEPVTDDAIVTLEQANGDDVADDGEDVADDGDVDENNGNDTAEPMVSSAR